jgi:molybdopterin-guanine dinucleotide biosynthesis protein A
MHEGDAVKASSIVLAGGRSSRMRTNKAFAEVSGQKLIENVLGKVSATFDEVILVTNEPENYYYYAKESVRIVTDIIPRKGPLSGVHTGLFCASHDLVLTVPCDMPFLNMELAVHMVDMVGDREGVVPRTGTYIHPLFAAYSKRCLPVVEESLLAGRLKIRDVCRMLDILYLDESEIRRFGDPAMILHNVNTRGDLKYAEGLIEKVII